MTRSDVQRNIIHLENEKIVLNDQLREMNREVDVKSA